MKNCLTLSHAVFVLTSVWLEWSDYCLKVSGLLHYHFLTPLAGESGFCRGFSHLYLLAPLDCWLFFRYKPGIHELKNPPSELTTVLFFKSHVPSQSDFSPPFRVFWSLHYMHCPGNLVIISVGVREGGGKKKTSTPSFQKWKSWLFSPITFVLQMATWPLQTLGSCHYERNFIPVSDNTLIFFLQSFKDLQSLTLYLRNWTAFPYLS